MKDSRCDRYLDGGEEREILNELIRRLKLSEVDYDDLDQELFEHLTLDLNEDEAECLLERFRIVLAGAQTAEQRAAEEDEP